MIVLSSMNEAEEMRRKFELQYRKKIPSSEIRFSSNIYGATSLHPQRLPARMSQERRDNIYAKWNNDLTSKGLKEHEIRNLDRSKIAIFMPIYYQHDPIRFYATLCEELGHNVAYSHRIAPRVSNEAVALACRFKGLLEAAKEGKFSLDKVIERIESDIKEYTHGPFSWLMHYHKALDYAITKYNPHLEFRNRNPDDLIWELNKSLDYMFKTYERIKYDLNRLHEKIKLYLKKRNTD